VILSRDKFFVVGMKIVGEARSNNAGVVLLRQVPRVGGITQFLKSIRKEELKAVPWWKIAMLAVILLVLGVLIIYFEGDRPKSRFLREVEKMVQKEGERLNIYLFRGKYRKLADAINRAIDKAVQVLVSKATSEAPSVSKILGAKPSPDDRLSKPAFEMPDQISLDDIPPPPPAAGEKTQPTAQPKKGRSKTVPSGGAPLPQAPQAPQAPLKPQAPQVPLKPPPQKPQAPQPTKSAKPTTIQWGGGLDEEETRIYEGEKGGPLPPIPSDSAPPAQAPAVRPAAGRPPADEAEVKKVFDEFYKTKVACGENVQNLTFERFKATLKKQEEAIRERTRCKKVEFRVYVKDGKAALKASPIK
jgi:hypothetical protein